MAENLAHGFAALNGGTSGGNGGAAVLVSTGIQLQEAINTALGPLTIYVTGAITPENSGLSASGLVEININGRDDLSIVGVGPMAEFDRIGLRITGGSSNLIVQNLKFHHVDTGVKDAISIEGPSSNIWIDHNELYSTMAVDIDYYDGLLDIKNGAEYITVSNNYFHDHHKVMLAGFSDADLGSRYLTVDHNVFENVGSRLPSLRYGYTHVYENYFNGVDVSAINLRMGAVGLIENNVFQNTHNPIVSFDSTVPGTWDLRGNLLYGATWDQPGALGENSVGITAENGVSTAQYDVPYAYTQVGTPGVKDHDLANAGVGHIPLPPDLPPVDAVVGRKLTGTKGTDTLAGGLGGDLIDGAGGADSLRGGDGNDTMLGNTGDDQLFGGDDADSLLGGAGKDRLWGEAGHDTLDGGDSNDTLDGGDGNDSLQGGSGDDQLAGGIGIDLLLGGIGRDRLLGEAGNDTLEGGDGNDTLLGGAGYDLLRAGTGDNMLDGGEDDDTLLGGATKDTLEGGAGADSVDGGAGIDTASYAGATAGVEADLAAGTGTAGDAAGDVLVGIENLQGSAWADLLRGDALANLLQGGGGGDRLDGGNGADKLLGEAGDDTLAGGLGADTLTGGAGADRFVWASVEASSKAVYDTIADFSQADGDRLDLGGIGALAFIGNGVSFHKLAGELRARVSSGVTYIESDLNGDGKADTAVKILGVHLLGSGDFLL